MLHPSKHIRAFMRSELPVELTPVVGELYLNAASQFEGFRTTGDKLQTLGMSCPHLHACPGSRYRQGACVGSGSVH